MHPDSEVRMYRVIMREQIVPNIHRLIIESEYVPRNARAGEFLVVRVDEAGERIPLNLVDWDERSVSTVFMEVGTSTRKLAQLKAGDSIATLAGPLGKPTEEIAEKHVLCIGGCYGIAALLPVIRMFKNKGNHVTTIIEARSRSMLYWQDQLSKYSDEFHEMTRDGSRGRRGHVNDFIMDYLKDNKVDMVYAQGCTYLTYLTSESTRGSGIKTIVGLNPIMVDATGMCGVCRVIVNGETKFGCVDGPEFDGHQVEWQNLLNRRRIYIREEVYSLSYYECETYG